jgi:hypothetical protein
MRFDLSEGFPMVTTKNYLNLLFTNYFGFSKEILNIPSRKQVKYGILGLTKMAALEFTDTSGAIGTVKK